LNARLRAWYRATVTDAELATEIVPYQRWYSRAEELARDYAAGQPFPVVVMDDFLNLAAASAACSAFPPLSNDRWISYIRVNERKFGMRDREIMPAPIRTILDELNSDAFVELVSAITGIPVYAPITRSRAPGCISAIAVAFSTCTPISTFTPTSRTGGGG
jgi:hypothetical protein